MEYYQSVQQRNQQTVAVMNQFMPGLIVNGQSAADLAAADAALTATAQQRDDDIAFFDDSNNTGNLNALAINRLTLALPAAAEGELDDDVPREEALISLLGPVYAINPQTNDLTIQRGQKTIGALKIIDAYRATLTPARLPVVALGKTGADLAVLIAAQTVLDQSTENRASKMNDSRGTLRADARELDRQDKRVYKRLTAEARGNAALAAGLSQILTENANQPGTLGITGIVQGGTDSLHLLVSYTNSTYDGTAESTLEWLIDGLDSDFTKSMPVDPSGNALGPFAVDQIVKIRTRVSNANGTTTGSVRTIKIKAPVT